MNEYTLRGRLLVALFHRTQRCEVIELFALAEDCSTSLYAVLKGLDSLDRAGLADARRARLTLSGLVLAAALCKAAGAREDGSRKSQRPPAQSRHAA